MNVVRAVDFHDDEAAPSIVDPQVAVEMMGEWGGGFVRALAAAWVMADAENKSILELSFPFYFQSYFARALALKASQEKS